jgi:transposase
MARSSGRRVIGGVDTHGQTHHAAVVTSTGRHLADHAFPASADGYAQLLAWLRSHGRLVQVGVEGTGAYGAGLARHLHAAGVKVIEVDRPNRRTRRAKGKSDPIDAYAAAEAVLAGRVIATPKTRDGAVEAIRALHTVRAGAIRARTVAINQLRALLVTAPTQLRDQLTTRRTATLVEACSRLSSDGDPANPATASVIALRSLAHRYRQLAAEIDDLEAQLRPLIDKTAPGLVAMHGVGYETAAQLLITAGDNPERLRSEAAFAHLCGVAPIPASSGKTNRHRLNRGGDRQANRALHMIVVTRLGKCPTTRAYRQRRASQQLSTPEIIRCIKRYAARQIYRALINLEPLNPRGSST